MKMPQSHIYIDNQKQHKSIESSFLFYT
jgi:hypothetical protein